MRSGRRSACSFVTLLFVPGPSGPGLDWKLKARSGHHAITLRTRPHPWSLEIRHSPSSFSISIDPPGLNVAVASSPSTVTPVRQPIDQRSAQGVKCPSTLLDAAFNALLEFRFRHELGQLGASYVKQTTVCATNPAP